MKQINLNCLGALIMASLGATAALGQAPANESPTAEAKSPVAGADAKADQAAESDARYDKEDAPPAPGSEAERQSIWNSPEMLEARAWVEEYMARSARISPSQAKRYMDQLERLSAAQMKQWLATFQKQQAERQRERATFDAARQMSIDNAMRANQATRQAEQNASRIKAEAAQVAQESLSAQQQAAQQRALQKARDRNAAATAALQPSSYIWLNTLPWGPYAGYPIGGGAAIDPAAFQGVLGVQDRQPEGVVAPGTPKREVPIR